MPVAILGPVKGNRLPSTAIPGSKGSGRPVAQKGGGGNKEAGSKEVTAATAPTVTVHSNGSVTAEHFSPSKAGEAAQVAAVARQRASEARTKRIVALVTAKPKTKAPVAEGIAPKAPSKPQIETRPAISAPPKEAKASAEAIGVGPKTPGGKEMKLAPRTVTVAAHTRKAPEPKLKGTRPERVQARGQLRQAKKALAKSKPRLVGDFGPAQRKFIAKTAKLTGLSPKTIAVQSIAEEGHGPGSPAASYEAKGENNFLNLGPGQHYATPQEGARATAENFKGPVYASVEAQRGKGAKAQLAAIEASPWDGEEHYGGALQKILAEGQVKLSPGDPQAVANYKAAVKKAKSLGMKVGKPMPDVEADPGAHTVKVKATAKAAVEWLEANLGENESGPKIQRLAENFGLNAVTEPWCANLVSNNLARRGFKTSELPANPNYTPSYEEWGAAGKYATDIGTNIAKAKIGDVLAFSGQHTATYVGNGEMISGNFSNEVMRTPVSEGPAPLSMIIRPHYKGGWIKVKEMAALPGTVNPTGSLSESSAAAVVNAVASPGTSGSGKQNRSPKERLSAPQRVRNAEATLKAGDLKAGKEAEAPSTSVLAELQRKYGTAA